MQVRIPIATDNIYKFYALFGLVLIVSGVAGFITTYNFHFNEITNTYLELEALKKLQLPNDTQLVQIEVLEHKLNVYGENKKFYGDAIAWLLGAGIAVSFYGFLIWHTSLQPAQDRLLALQTQKAELEIELLSKKIKPGRSWRRPPE